MILDTNILVDLVRGNAKALAWLSAQAATPSVCGFAAIELVSGCRDGTEEKRVLAFLARFPILWPTQAGMERALADLAPMKRTHGISVVDSLIAATALEHRLPLVTLNIKHFRAIPGLTMVQPYTP